MMLLDGDRWMVQVSFRTRLGAWFLWGWRLSERVRVWRVFPITLTVWHR